VRRAALLLAALALAGCGGGDDDAAPTPAPPATDQSGGVVELENVLGLAADFRADEGRTRVLLLLSPT
jgi:nitrous oxide reductase accessory protein NosL